MKPSRVSHLTFFANLSINQRGTLEEDLELTTQPSAGVRPNWVDADLFPFEKSLHRAKRPRRALRRRGLRANPADAARKSDLVLRIPRRHRITADSISLHRTGLPRIRPVGRSTLATNTSLKNTPR